VAAVFFTGFSEPPRMTPKYKIEMLQIQPEPRREAYKLYHAGTGIAARNAARGPQTLMVEKAPPLALQQPIPLPLAISSMALASSSLPAAPLAALNLVSLPEPQWETHDAAIAPRVNEASEAGEAPKSNQPMAEATSPEAISREAIPAEVASPNTAGAIRIDLPRDGKPRTSILGESAEMPGRIVSTVYLRFGLRKNWILEYWTEGGGPAADAPWAYTIFRPNLPLPADADALPIRGRLSAEGQLEQLSLLAGADWPEKDAFFRTLAQWKFRPAARNGKTVAVEILLVVPRQPDE
jgi:hypothetical protein